MTHEKTRQILTVFEEISRIPRCSKNEAQIIDFMQGWAEDRGFKSRTDEVGNIVIEVPASKGYEKSPVVVLQGHLDMVCEKTPDSKHDFSKDPIVFDYESEPGWLKARQTTLGADNGIAMAMAMVAADDPNLPHPPMELLFTVDEETGLTGANALQPGFIKGRLLLNIDSEDEGVFTVGCAGGRDTKMSLNLDYREVPEDYSAFEIKACDMTGGHSGVNIHEERANAIRVLARTLNELRLVTDLRITYISGGTAHNAIPRDAAAVVFVPAADAGQLWELVAGFSAKLADEFRNTDPRLKISMDPHPGSPDRRAMTESCSDRVIAFILALPHGVAAMSTDMKGLVETSNNLANVKVDEGKIHLLTSQRSSVMSRLHAITAKVEAVARLAGADYHSGQGYPAWQPNMKSKLLEKCQQVYQDLFGRQPKVEVIHAGLECGIIGDKNPGMDMISFGPDLRNPHSPDEKISIEAIGKVWDFMAALLKSLK